jgi:hypothetical protein
MVLMGWLLISEENPSAERSTEADFVPMLASVLLKELNDM